MTGGADRSAPLAVGVDLGGTKIAGVALDASGRPRAEHRTPAPRDNYDATIRAVGEMVRLIEQQAEGQGSIGRSIGIGMPGSLSPGSGLVQNANSTWLNGKPFQRDLETHLGRPVRLANDANCFALSEAVDGSGAGARSVFGVIIGTGCGGGLVFNGMLIDGPRGIGGEWGHNPLPWPEAGEHPGPQCWCGRRGCLETWVSGPGIASDHAHTTGERLGAEEIASRASAGDSRARATLDRHAGRLARGLACVVNVFDPEVIVLGGGLSKLAHLYDVLPRLMAPHVFAEHPEIVVKPPVWGDAGGARGAAWLWNCQPGRPSAGQGPN